MKLLTFLFILGSLSIGFAGGMTFMAIFYKSLIKEHLKAGVNLEGIAHLEQSEGLRIR